MRRAAGGEGEFWWQTRGHRKFGFGITGERLKEGMTVWIEKEEGFEGVGCFMVRVLVDSDVSHVLK